MLLKKEKENGIIMLFKKKKKGIIKGFCTITIVFSSKSTYLESQLLNFLSTVTVGLGLRLWRL